MLLALGLHGRAFIDVNFHRALCSLLFLRLSLSAGAEEVDFPPATKLRQLIQR